MRREFKFRAKTTDGKWMYGIPYKTPLGFWSMRDKDGTGYCIDPDTIGQFTECYDVTGREIYEDDILAFGYEDWPSFELAEDNPPYLCRWKNTTFETTPITLVGTDQEEDETYPLAHTRDMDYPRRHFKIIGNKYDNPEIFKQK